MAITAINQFGPEWFTLDGQEDDDNPGRVKLQGLDGQGQAEVAPELRITEDGIEPTPRGIRILFRYGLVDWDNITDLGGAALPFPHEAPGGHCDPLEAQRRLPYKVQSEICRRLFELTFAGPEDKKKSPSPPKS